jgi:hypothetical protein
MFYFRTEKCAVTNKTVYQGMDKTNFSLGKVRKGMEVCLYEGVRTRLLT